DAKAPGGAKKPDAVALARADVDASECAVTNAAAELSSVKSRADAMKAQWAVEDDKSGNAKLIAAAKASSNKAVAAQRQAELTKALFAVADVKRRLLRAPAEQKATIEAELAKARESRNKLTKMVDTPIGKDEHFTVIVGAQAAPTRFLSTVEDDKQHNW